MGSVSHDCERKKTSNLQVWQRFSKKNRSWNSTPTHLNFQRGAINLSLDIHPIVIICPVFLFTRWKTDYLKSLHCPIWACACGHVLYLRIYVPYACISSWCAMKTLHISQERSCLRVYIHMNSWPFFLLFIWCSLSSCSAHWSKAGNKHSTAWNSPTTRIQRTEVANLEGFLKTHCGSILHSVNH